MGLLSDVQFGFRAERATRDAKRNVGPEDKHKLRESENRADDGAPEKDGSERHLLERSVKDVYPDEGADRSDQTY